MTLNEYLGIGNGKTHENWTYWWYVSAVVAGICHHRSLTDDTKHQVALNIYELDVFPLQVWGGFAPPAKNRGSEGQRPPAKNISKKLLGTSSLPMHLYNDSPLLILQSAVLRVRVRGVATSSLHIETPLLHSEPSKKIENQKNHKLKKYKIKIWISNLSI